ncbi:drosomycin-like [Diabrotica undecimpunctata]|uniref:drosomycin-like n=1 Tax=Diabrotica undecimpunctata TaxID=50387 RepID=UPI003B63C2E9
MKVLHFLAVLLLLSVSAKTAFGDCLSANYGGPCAVWDNETCRRVCKGEGRVSGHCSPSLKCWCEGC